MVKIECVCPPKADGEKRHPDGDTVRLRPRLDFVASLTARNAVNVLRTNDAEASTAEVLAVLTEAYLIGGIEAWSITDAKGKPLPVSREAIRAFMADYPDAAMEVGDGADELYTKAVLAPLVARALKSLPPTPTEQSTSPTNGSPRTPRKRSKPSSITTIPTADTERMTASHGGGYS